MGSAGHIASAFVQVDVAGRRGAIFWLAAALSPRAGIHEPIVACVPNLVVAYRIHCFWSPVGLWKILLDEASVATHSQLTSLHSPTFDQWEYGWDEILYWPAASHPAANGLGSP